MALKKGNEIPTIDVALVTIKSGTDEFALNTASQIQISPTMDSQEAVNLIIKGVLVAQKRAVDTLTGNEIILTDNVFNPEIVQILQGGEIEYDEEETTKVISYTPPVVGSNDKGSVFELSAYSAIYDAAGIIQGYEKITYPNCKGSPVGFNSEDNVFRAPEYTITSSPTSGEAPYEMSWVEELPVIS